MTLRDLMEKAAKEPDNDEYALLLAEALHNLAPEMQRVIEAAEEYEKYMNIGGITVAFGVTPGEKLRAALRALREKESSLPPTIGG